MFEVWILLFLPLLGARGFMVHNMQHSLCLEEARATGEVLLKNCNLDSESQQWTWMDQGLLMSVASFRCLSALQREPVHTGLCWGPEVDVRGLMWDCDRGRLISRNTSMLLSVDGWRLTLAHDSKHSRWKSLDEGDICHENLRSKRASKHPEEFELTAEAQTDDMTEEQREYLRWFYRTEDPTIWKFVLLGLAFVCLLVGFLLLGMGAMANKSRRKIAKYKVAAAVAQRSEELEIIVPLREDQPAPPNGEVSELKAGHIMVTWKDGNISSLYSDPVAEQEKQEDQEEKQEEDQEEKHEENQEKKQEENQEEKQEENQEEKQEEDQEEKQEEGQGAKQEVSAEEAVRTIE
ncbi:solute carrier family 51 subunit beta [Eleginops maclovinus]|uniref:solute carrier family 51 subunit beta n=1 Tax=Eleginops maclovinus TaxID=56733 RepID=UPI003080BACC